MSAHLNGRGLAQNIREARPTTPGQNQEVDRWKKRLEGFDSFRKLSRPVFKPGNCVCNYCKAEAHVTPGYKHRHCPGEGTWEAAA